MRIQSGDTSRKIFFVAVDSTDLKTRETGLTTFTVYRSRDGGTATVFTTPTVAELSAANMPGVYSLVLDEDMTITATVDSEEMAFHITQAAMAPVTRTIELYRPKITSGSTLGVASDGDVSGNVDGNVVGTVASVVGAVASVSGAVGSVTAAIVLPTIPGNWITAAGINATALNGKGDWNINKTGYSLTTADWNVGKTGYSISGSKTTLDALVDLSAADVNAQVLDVLNVDTFSMPGSGAPTATPTIREALFWLYKFLRNKKDGTATLIQLYDDAGSTVHSKRTVSKAAGTYTEEEIVTGP